MNSKPHIIESLDALTAKLDALLREAQATRELLQTPRPHVAVQSIPLVEAAKLLGCSLRRVEQLLKNGVLKAGRKYGRRGMVTLESISQALQPIKCAPGSSRRTARRASALRWQPIDRAHLR